VLQLYTEHGASEVCEQLRLRCEAARGNGVGGGGSGVGRSLGADRVALRELHLSDGRLGGDDLSDLALLPHLEHLECRVSAGGLDGLSGLRRLRSLNLRFGEEWTDAAMRKLRLPPLESFALTRDRSHLKSQLLPTVTGSLSRLLEIPRLTHLQLPWLSADQATLLRLLHCASGPWGRRDLFIDTARARAPMAMGLFDV
jgi:hypothetical protein